MSGQPTITFEIPLNRQTLDFVKKAMSEASSLGLPTESYVKQLEIAEITFQIEDKQTEINQLNLLKQELEGNGD